MKIKNTNSVLVTLFILTSCSSAPIVVPTEAAVPTSTFTPILPIPTITPTLDPMKNAPNGATSIDKDGKYYLEVDGYKFYYFEATPEQEAYWARPYIENYYAYDHWDINAIPIDVWVKLGTPGSESIVKMTHRDVKNSDDKSGTQTELNTDMLKRFNMTELKDLRAALSSGTGLTYDFKFNGQVMTGRFSSGSGIEITLVNPEELIGNADTVVVQGITGMMYYTIDGVRDDGTVKFRMAHKFPLDKLLVPSTYGNEEYEFRFMIMTPLANLLVPDADQFKVYNISLASGLAIRTAETRVDGKQDLQIEYK